MKPWLTVIGVGLDGDAGLSAAARHALAAAQVVAGSERLLDACAICDQRRYAWPSPITEGLAHIARLRGRAVVVLATGDPMHFGVGGSLANVVAPSEMTVLPAPSAFSLAAARLGWPLQNVRCMSVHGRPLATLNAALHPGARLLLLTSDGDAPGEIMALLKQAGYGRTQVAILENLGGPDETRHDLLAEEHGFASYAQLNTVALDCVADEGVQALPLMPGLADAAFAHDGQLTKRDVRAATLAALAPSPGQRLWDVGAGCGSVAIEWLRAAPQSEAVAFERDQERIAMIERNAARLGVPHLSVVAGGLPTTLAGQARPDAVFHGGAVGDDDVFAACWQALAGGGRMVANAVTLEGEAALGARHREHGGELVRIAVSHVTSVGRYRGMQPAMAVMQWRVVKP